MTDMEEEAQERQRAAERREVEEEERKQSAARRLEVEESKRVEVGGKSTKVTARGAARAGSAGRGAVASTPSSSYVQMSGANASGSKRGTSSTRRTTSGIGRGTASRGGRGRG